MKNALRLLGSIALATTFALPAFAQTTPSPSPAQDTTAQDNEARAAAYDKFVKNYRGNPEQQKVAYETGKEYVAKYGSLTDPSDVQILDFVKGWLAKYEKAAADFQLKKDFDDAVNKKDWARAFELGNKILASEPENVPVTLTLANIGYANATAGRAANKTLFPESHRLMKRAIELIEAGKATPAQLPFPTKDEAAGHYTVGISFIQLESQPEEAAKSLIKLAQTNSASGKNPLTYSSLAYFYTREYRKAATEYQQKFPDGTEITPELKPEYDRLTWQLDKIKDRIIDAYARAVALSTKPEQQAGRNEAMTDLTVIYKNRHNNSDAGLKELIAGVLAKPLMLPGQEPTPAPAPATTTSTTPATGGNPQTSQTAAPAGGNTAAPKPAPAGTTKPAAPANTNAKPKPSSTAPASTTPRPISKKATKSAGRHTAAGH